MPERWKPVVGYEGLYEVSNCGRVRRIVITQIIKRITTKDYSRTWPAKILKQESNKSGHLRVALYDGNGIRRYRYIHQLVLEAFIGPCQPRQECRHLDGKETNNKNSNLCWGSKAENEADKRKHGTAYPNAKLTPRNVREIRRLRESGCDGQEIANLFSISRNHVYRIAKGLRWRYIDG